MLAELSAEAHSRKSWEISNGLGLWLSTRPDLRHVAIFAALPGEPQVNHLHLLAPTVGFVYPLVHAEHRLSFHLVSDAATLEAGHLGIPEPHPQVHPELAVGDIDAFFCPGLAFSEGGVRLGRGGGFYDRALAKARPEALRTGVFFGEQICSALEGETHDITMTHLADESGVREITPSPADSV